MGDGSEARGIAFSKEGTMLVLSRHKFENIVIGDDIIITVVEIRGDKVRLGITAPKDVPVNRQEVHTRKKQPHATDPHQDRELPGH